MRFRLLLILFLCLFAARAVVADSSNSIALLADEDQVIHVSADRIVRRQADDLRILDLEGDVSIVQDRIAVRAPRIRAWFWEISEEGRKRARLEFYCEAPATVTHAGQSVLENEAGLFRLTTVRGLVLTGETAVRGDTPEDEFSIRAEECRALGPVAAAEARIEREQVAHLDISAEEVLGEGLDRKTGGAVTLHGNAEVRFRTVTLFADTVRVRLAPESGQEGDQENVRVTSIYAEGAVALELGAQHILADSVFLDLDANQGIASNARARFIPAGRETRLQFYAETIRQTDRYTFEVEGPCYITSSVFSKPHYRIEGQRVRLTRREDGSTESDGADGAMILTSKHNVLYLKSLPVFYWPYVAKDVSKPGFLIKRVKAGHSGRNGNFAEVEWDLYQLGLGSNDWSELTLHTDVYTERGFGIGPYFEYEVTPDGQDTPSRYGFVRGYYINDTAREDDRNLLVPQDNRGELTVRHREMLPDDFRLDLELGYLSDRNFLRTYDREEFDEGKDRETQAFLSRIRDNTFLTARAKGRVNDFVNTLEQQSASYHVIGEPLFGLPVIATGHADVSRYRLRTDTDLNLPNTDPVTRFDTAAELSTPFSLGPLRIDPYAWNNLTTYTRGAADGGNVERFASAFGTRGAMNFYRTFHADNDLLDLDGLRHVVTPTVEYENMWLVTRDPAELFQSDEVDALDNLHRTRVGLRNRLQTYRRVGGQRRLVDFLTLDTDYLFHHRNSGADRNIDDYFEASAEWRVTENIILSSKDNRYNFKRDRFESLSGDLSVGVWDALEVGVGHQYYVDVTDPSNPTHSISRLSIRHKPKYSRWTTELSTSYDFHPRRRPGDTRDPRRLGSALTLTRQLEGWEVILGAEFNQDRGNQTTFSISIRLPRF